jgi:hypothetical protein
MVPDSAATASAMFTGVKVITVNYAQGNHPYQKGLCHQLNFCLKVYTIKSVLSVHRQSFSLIFSLSSSRGKLIRSFCLVLWKHLPILTNVLKATSSFCSFLLLLSLVDFFQCTFSHIRLLEQFSDHSRGTEQLFETQAAIISYILVYSLVNTKICEDLVNMK